MVWRLTGVLAACAVLAAGLAGEGAPALAKPVPYSKLRPHGPPGHPNKKKPAVKSKAAAAKSAKKPAAKPAKAKPAKPKTPAPKPTVTKPAGKPATPPPSAKPAPPPPKPTPPAPKPAPPPVKPAVPVVVAPPVVAPPAPPKPAPAAPIASAAAPPAATAPPIAPSELQAFIDGAAAAAMARDHIAGMTVAVVQNGQVVLTRGYGVDRLAPARAVDPERTLFRLGGITSTFTWIGLMRQVEAGRLREDASINLYLPQSDQVRDQGYDQPVQLRQLMSHTAGFEERAYGQLMERNPARIRTLGTYLRQERPRRVRSPGALPTFSYYGAALAGEALVQVSGLTPQAEFERTIAQPLGLHRSTLREPYPAREGLPAPMDPALADDLSEGYAWTGTGYLRRPTEFMTQLAPAASGSSTAADMARYLLALLGNGSHDGATLFGPAAAKAFHTPAQPLPEGVRGFDHGFKELALPGGRTGYGHQGETLAFRANLVTAPDLGLGVFVAANTDTAGPFTRELPAMIIQRFYGGAPPLPQEPSDWLDQNASAFEGVYLTTRRAYGGLESFVDVLKGQFRLKVQHGFLVTPDDRRWAPVAGSSLDQATVRLREVGGADEVVFQMQQGRGVRWFDPAGTAVYQRAGAITRGTWLKLFAVIAGIAAVSCIGGLFARARRESRQTSIQGRADGAQISAAALWLLAMGSFWLWLGGSDDLASLMYSWPGGWLLIASACAFVATLMTLLCLGLLPAVWQGGRRLDSWTAGRKASFTFTTLLFTLFAVLLGMWGGLEPWSR